jgi:7-carboxy-7-deazaguanine synthase
MTYSVKEIFYTLQGEGIQAGRPAVFCRFAGCNLWTGREEDREKAVCRFCDTDFVGTDGTLGGKFISAQELARTIAAQWPQGHGQRYVVLTGGEPLLQVDAALLDALHVECFEIAVETNGTVVAPEGIDWICVSPKAGAPLLQRRGHELKLVYPQPGLDPTSLEELDFEHFLLQPMDSPAQRANTQAAIELCQARPRWRLSIQTHKVLAIR